MSFTHLLNLSDASTSSIYQSLDDLYGSSMFDTADILYEHTIQVEGIRNALHARWGITYLIENHFNASFSLADMAYPRLVKQFYKNLRNPNPIAKGLTLLETTVDGFPITLSGPKIDLALGLEPYGSSSTTGTEEHYPLDTIIKEMCNGLCGRRKSIRRVHMAKKMWIIDNIFRRTIFPRGYNHCRTGRNLQALMAVYRKEWFSPGSCVMLDMWDITKEIYENGFPVTVKLLFPRIITRILRANNFLFLPNEVIVTQFPIFGEKDWIRSYRQLAPRRMAERDAANKAKDSAPSSAILHTQFNQIIQSMTSISQKQDHILRIQKELANAHCILDRRTFNIEVMLAASIEHQHPAISRQIWDSANLAEQQYVGPTFNLETTVSDRIEPSPIVPREDTNDDSRYNTSDEEEDED